MSEIATQTEAKNIHRNVSTQCGKPERVVVSVMTEYFAMKEINAHPRRISSRKSKPALKAGMRISVANTDKVQKSNTHRKNVGTDEWTLIEEEQEIIVLKEINHIKAPAKNAQNAATGRKRTWRQARVSRHEKLYADILRSEARGMQKRMRGIGDKENIERERRKRREGRRKMNMERENGNLAHNSADRRAKWPTYRRKNYAQAQYLH